MMNWHFVLKEAHYLKKKDEKLDKEKSEKECQIGQDGTDILVKLMTKSNENYDGLLVTELQ